MHFIAHAAQTKSEHCSPSIQKTNIYGILCCCSEMQALQCIIEAKSPHVKQSMKLHRRNATRTLIVKLSALSTDGRPDR